LSIDYLISIISLIEQFNGVYKFGFKGRIV